MLDAIFWIASTCAPRRAAPWRDVPAELGNWNSVFRQFRRCTCSGLWDVMLEALADGGAGRLQMIDSTSTRSHHGVAGGRRAHRQGLGCSRGGFTSKLQIRGNAYGWPVALYVTAGQEAGCSNHDALMDERNNDPAIMLGAKGCGSEPFRQDLRNRARHSTSSTTPNAHSPRCVAASSASSTA